MIRDDVQHVKKHKYPDGRTDKSYQVHAPIKQSFGKYLLSVPVKNKFALISDTLVSYDNNWVSDHLKALQVAYGRAPNFHDIYRDIELILSQTHKTISDLNIVTICWAILKLLGEKDVTSTKLATPFVTEQLKKSSYRLKDIRKASESAAIKTKNLENPNEKIMALCKEVGATEDYCGGTGHAAYMDESLYKKNGIGIIVQDWTCGEYQQLFTKEQGFIPNLSIIDLLMNEGIEKAREIIAG